MATITDYGLILLLVPVFLSPLPLPFMIRRWLRKLRIQQMQTVAKAWGVPFSPDDDAALAGAVSSLGLLRQGASREVTSVIELDNARLFDYRIRPYSMPFFYHRNFPIRQTLILFQLPMGALPHFTLRPKNIFDLRSVFPGSKNIDFPSHPQFSHDYRLRGSGWNEEEVRQLFDDEILAFFEQHPRLWIAGRSRRLLFCWGQGRTVPPERLGKFVREGQQLCNLFQQRLHVMSLEAP